MILIGGPLAIQGSLGRGSQVQAAEPVAGDESRLPVATVAGSSTTTTSTTTTTTTTTTPTTPPPPSQAPQAYQSRYIVPPTEAEPEAKQLAADIASSLTTYGASDDHAARLNALAGRSGGDLLAQASQPLIYPGSWSQGQVIYPQMGGLGNGRASVMVMTRQTVGSDGEVDFSIVRTLDIRLILGESGWEFDSLSSAGGTFDRLEDLALAHAVARDPRIQMPDSARLDILSGLVSPVLLTLMADVADQTPYEVSVLVTGHPHNVFETDRMSDHTAGRAIDIVRVGDHRVIDDRGEESATRALVEWLYHHPDVRQVGSPWDLDEEPSRRSFTDAVHQDHIHVAVNAP
ncbi:MAG: hypothetical protein A2135_08345 [Actinobacteria bacterium RBG_16_67_15]|nr:MAG: hypothetical protein A2135_08345 [Actinobacteria bacterium RBG_16_67_15]